MSDDPAIDILAAQRREAVARTRLVGTLDQLKARLKPKSLARDAARAAADAGQSAARTGAETARRNPGPLAGVVAVAGLFLARHRIAALFRRGGGKHATTAAPARSRKHASSEDQS